MEARRERVTDVWTADRVKLLTECYLEGASASEIAGILGNGITRNAVIGKITRLKLQTLHPLRKPKARIDGARPQLAERVKKGRAVALKKAKPGGRAGEVAKARAEARSGQPVAVEYVPPAVLRERWAREDGGARMIPLEMLNEHLCKWPIGTPGEAGFGFCGLSKEDGEDGPYCAIHHRRGIRLAGAYEP